MPYFVEYFDRRPGVTTEQVAEACRRVTERWARHWPTNVDLGLFRRKHGIGAGPMYYWVWELPDIGSVQEWDKEFSIDEVREAVDGASNAGRTRELGRFGEGVGKPSADPSIRGFARSD